MRRVRHAGVVCLAVPAGAGPAASSDAPLGILVIGDSLTCTNDLPLMARRPGALVICSRLGGARPAVPSYVRTEAGLVQGPPRQAAVPKAGAEALEPLAPRE